MTSQPLSADLAGTYAPAVVQAALTSWVRRRWPPIALALVLAAIWQGSSGTLFNAYYLSRPTAIAAQVWAWAVDGTLWRHLSATLVTTLAGFAGAAVAGIAAGLLLASVRALDRILQPFVFVAYSLPKIVLAPLLILWLGIGSWPAIGMAFLTGFFMVFFNVYSGVRAVSPALVDTVTLMGAGRLRTALTVRLPAALPFVALGLHQGLVYAFHGAIVGEMTASNRGLGYLLVYAASDMDANGVLAALCVLAVLSLILLRLLALAIARQPGARVA